MLTRCAVWYRDNTTVCSLNKRQCSDEKIKCQCDTLKLWTLIKNNNNELLKETRTKFFLGACPSTAAPYYKQEVLEFGRAWTEPAADGTRSDVWCAVWSLGQVIVNPAERVVTGQPAVHHKLLLGVTARRAAHASDGAMKVKVISILEDNYMYLVIEEQSKQALAVDPAVPHRVRGDAVQSDLQVCKTTLNSFLLSQDEFNLYKYFNHWHIIKIFAAPPSPLIGRVLWLFTIIFHLRQLLEIVKREGVSLTAVLTTHHHWWDHNNQHTGLYCRERMCMTPDPSLTRPLPWWSGTTLAGMKRCWRSFLGWGCSGETIGSAAWRIKSPTTRSSRCERWTSCGQSALEALAHQKQMRTVGPPLPISPCGPLSFAGVPLSSGQILLRFFSCVQFSSINVRCLFTPCHTSGHMCYFVWEDECSDAPAVFTGERAARATTTATLSVRWLDCWWLTPLSFLPFILVDRWHVVHRWMWPIPGGDSGADVPQPHRGAWQPASGHGQWREM